MASFHPTVYGLIWLALSLSQQNITSVQTPPVNHHEIRKKIAMLQNDILEYWKLNENLIINDFEKPYIVIVFAS